MSYSTVNPTVIFDFDGTIADSMDAFLGVYNRIAPEYGCRTIPENDRFFLRKRRPQECFREYGMTILKLPVIVLRMRKEARGCITGIKPFPGVVEAIRELGAAGYTLGVVSSNAPENVRRFLAHHDLTRFFDFVQGSKHVFGKHMVIKRLFRTRGIRPGCAVYVGDETRDVEAARKSGIPVISVSWGYQAREALAASGPDRIVDSPADLCGTVGELFGRTRS